MSAAPPPWIIRLSSETARSAIAVALRPDAARLAEIAADLGLTALRKVALTGRLLPQGRQDWRLEARLGATVVQPCVVTLTPVTTRIDEDVTRTYAAGKAQAAPPTGEVEIPEDVDVEPLPPVLDLMDVLTEALALALPPFPRAPGAEFDGIEVTEPGKAPLGQGGPRPFAALAALRHDPGTTE
jgi:uncharacterized metal-binding protein YceD (DUF177 family)